MGVLSGFGQGIGNLGTALHLPELGISELLGTLGGGQVAGTGSQQSGYSKTGSADSGTITPTSSQNQTQPSGALTGGYDAAAAQAAAGRASALSEIDRILGNIGTKRDQGLSRLNSTFGDNQARLNYEKEMAMRGYADQRGENEKAKLRGTEQVDQFANNTYSNLRRMLSGMNAGSSSAMRELVPQVVSKAAGQRRQGVFETYGENEKGIDSAQENATTQYKWAEEDLANQRRDRERDFLDSIYTQEQDLIRQKQGLGGLDLGSANAQIAQRQASLDALFNQYAPQFSAKAVSAERPELGKYTIDKAAVRQGQGQFPSETAYYLPALRKKQEGLR